MGKYQMERTGVKAKIPYLEVFFLIAPICCAFGAVKEPICLGILLSWLINDEFICGIYR